MDEKKIDFLGPIFIMAVIAALTSDFAFVFLLALLIPVVGIAIALMVVMFHYFVGLLLLLLVFPNLNHLLPKLILILSILLPLPFLTVGIIFAVVLQNRIIEFIVTQAAIQAIAVATGGAGEILEAGALTAEAGAAAVEAGGAVARAGVAAAEAGTEAAEVGAGATRTAGEGLQLQQPIRERVRLPQEPATPEEVLEEPGPEREFESDDVKLSKRKKAMGDKWEKIKEGFDEREEKNVEESEDEEESNGI